MCCLAATRFIDAAYHRRVTNFEKVLDCNKNKLPEPNRDVRSDVRVYPQQGGTKKSAVPGTWGLNTPGGDRRFGPRFRSKKGVLGY